MHKNEKARPEEKGYTIVADVYRRDAIDRSHYPVFHQMECARLWKRPVTASDILKDLDKLPRHDVPVEDPNPAFHPERNPLQDKHHTPEVAEAIAAHLKRSLELLRYSGKGNGSKFLAPGVVKQELLVSSDVPDHIGWAFGLGLERIAMLLFNIPDIRLFWSEDPRFLSQFEAGKISRFAPFSKHPACYKDVAFWLRSTSTPAGGAAAFHENDIMEIVRDVAGNLVEDVGLVDEFMHPKTGRKSLCYRINYRSLEKTLTNKQVNELHENVKEKLVGRFGVELR
ncbi:hypothetical protein UREG_06445 [Uncinocarpus reesii 1704]|uniref:phenylalanine--tRNA ligase n=1 Tax=Uncinocarpus reesii (strain UAMH 1704) TaxID=336963 RepID=C4JV53_UNCRE|nr:uncharacterized protein UREG_06445 [Uncinocarpus reesii 1704]EEP81580.1 hypothetical protein UREG_06445 [Uncinocarpus reesii 1704]